MNRLAAVFLAFALGPALAADPPGPAVDPPARVGRLAWVEGEALVFSDPATGWESARVNTHLTSENSVWTEPRSRAEVRAGSIALRLEETTQLDIARLEDDELRAHLARGSLSVRVRYFEKGESIVVTTPEARFQVRGNGRYRIDADAGRGESRLTVFEGHARLEAKGGVVIVDTGRTVVVVGGDRPAYEFEQAVTTAIDEWALARDERYPERQASRYVSPRMTGWEDLDAYGEWRDEAEYGTVWYPSRVDAGWAPYRYGRWAYVRPWGWTWVDDAPWGYAPFHYGRWVYVRNRWGWYPGRYDPRPVWAPALVGWVGGSGWSLTINSGPVGVVGWYPLSPWDRYDPWYRCPPAYVTRVNRVVVVDRRPPNAVHYRDHATVASRDVFGSRRPVRDSMANVPREVIAQQPTVPGTAVLPAHGAMRPRPAAVPPGSPAPHGRPAAPTVPNLISPNAPTPSPGPAARPVPNVAAPARPQPSSPAPGYSGPPAQPPASAPARPAFTPRPSSPVPAETARPAAPAMPMAPAAPASPAVPPASRPATRPDYPPSLPAPAPNAASPRPEPAPVNRAPRGAPPESRPAEAPRGRPEGQREPRPPRLESAAPAPAAKPAEKPAQSPRPPKEDKPAKESGQKER